MSNKTLPIVSAALMGLLVFLVMIIFGGGLLVMSMLARISDLYSSPLPTIGPWVTGVISIIVTGVLWFFDTVERTPGSMGRFFGSFYATLILVFGASWILMM